MTLQELKNLNIEFIQITGVAVTKENTHNLNFILWENTEDDLEIRGYKVLWDIKETYDILNYFLMKNIPYNYYIGDFMDHQKLSCFAAKDSEIFYNSDAPASITKIELKVNKDTIYDVLVFFIKNDVEFFDENLQEYFSFKHLVLNKNNTNLSVRCFSKQKGYRTYFITDIFSNSLKIRALSPVTSVAGISQWHREPNSNNTHKYDSYYYYATYTFSNRSTECFYNLFINDELSPFYLLPRVLTPDCYISIFGNYFYLELIDKFLDAWISFFVSEESATLDRKELYSKKTRTSSTKSFLVESDFSIPTLKYFKEIILKYNLNKNFDNLSEFLEQIEFNYGNYVKDTLRNFLYNYKQNLTLNYINIQILKDKIENHLAIQTVKTACLKTTMLASPVFSNACSNAPDWILSKIFRYKIKLKIF